MNEIERAIERSKMIKKLISEIGTIKASLRASDPLVPWVEPQRYEEYELLESILTAELSRQENAPLTMDEIKKLYEASFSGYPVWCRYLNEYSHPFAAVIDRYDGEIVAVHAAGLKDNELNREEDYGKTWLAYRYEPKGEKECTTD